MNRNLAKRKYDVNSVTQISTLAYCYYALAMKAIDEIRRGNIKLLEKEAGGAAALAARVQMSYAQYVNLRDGAKDSRTGKPRGMRRATAARFEKAGGKDAGWLDRDRPGEDDSAAPPQLRSVAAPPLPPAIQRLAARMVGLKQPALAKIEEFVEFQWSLQGAKPAKVSAKRR